MTKYDVVQKCDGNLVIVSTWEGNIDGATRAFHDRCSLLINDDSFVDGYVGILDNQLNLVKSEYINHPVQPTPEPTEE